jgi:hypothetical protein
LIVFISVSLLEEERVLSMNATTSSNHVSAPTVHEFEMFHGIVLTKLVRRKLPVSLLMIETQAKEAWSEYKVNDQVILYVKHSTSPRSLKREGGIAWNFSFATDHVKRIRALRDGGDICIALVCGDKDLGELGSMQICLLEKHQLAGLLDLDLSRPQAIRVRYLPGTGKSLRVRGSLNDSAEELKVPRSGFDKWQVPGT